MLVLLSWTSISVQYDTYYFFCVNYFNTGQNTIQKHICAAYFEIYLLVHFFNFPGIISKSILQIATNQPVVTKNYNEKMVQ